MDDTYITEIVKHFSNGQNYPFLANCSDGKLYVIKTSPVNHQVEFNELIAYRYAKLLHLPIPDAKLVTLPDDVIKNDYTLQSKHYLPNICFASEYRKGIAPVTPPLFEQCNNTQDIPGIFVFDQLILNDDRGENLGNLLYDSRTKKIFIIDHSNIFKQSMYFNNSLQWSDGELTGYTVNPPTTVEISGDTYLYMSTYVSSAKDFDEVSDLLDNINEETINHLFYDIPTTWNITKNEIAACKSLLLSQKDNYQSIIDKLKVDCSKLTGGNS